MIFWEECQGAAWGIVLLVGGVQEGVALPRAGSGVIVADTRLFGDGRRCLLDGCVQLVATWASESQIVVWVAQSDANVFCKRQ